MGELALGDGIGGITHRTVAVNGIRLHIAEKGTGPAVLLLHGFPELWYSWRHQISYLSSRGYRAVAPDLRGFGDSDAPLPHDCYTMLHVVGDIVALIQFLGEEKVFVVGHDWGAIVAWNLCMFRPDLVRSVVALSVAFMPRNPLRKPLDTLRLVYGDDYYVCAFQEKERAEGEFAQIDLKLLMKKFLTYHDPKPVIVPRGKGFSTPPEKEIVLPAWLSEEDVEYFANKFRCTGFTGGVNYYRALDLNWELTAAWTGAQIKVPAKFIVGDEDLTYHFPGAKEYIHHGGFRKDVPLLQDVVVIEGAGHFINQEKAMEIAEHIYEFISNI
ncbi:alpha/beta-Hydrolases superfamily protein [Rhynchospora pubera]|uniref:soluble epoxide hydrolase n=1 Tax=Rhynchospora pubera TaxID=906938 RepID=A0AAV8ERQ3_9POAL|nr:alpha/beta-Hydrolases superfamily protein [Rhynchospora pubera]